MVDAGDLKSPDRKVVRVRLPLAPPFSEAASQANLSKSLQQFPREVLSLATTYGIIYNR